MSTRRARPLGAMVDGGTPALWNGLLASGSGREFEGLVARALNTANSTAYDKAIDAVYLAEGTGGSRLHHLVDGRHDIFGALGAAREAMPGDSPGAEILGAAHHLGKDLFSEMGLPVVSLDPDGYRRSSDWIATHLGISKTWQADFLQINGLELLGGGLAAAATVIGCQKGDRDLLLEIAGGTGLGAVLSANPLAMMAAVCALVFACRQRRDFGGRELASLSVGAGTAGAALGVGSALGGIAGAGALPLVGALALSWVSGLVVRRWLDRRLRPASGAVIDVPLEVRPDSAEWVGHLARLSERTRASMNPAALLILQKAFA